MQSYLPALLALGSLAAAAPPHTLVQRDCNVTAPNGGGPVPGDGSLAAYLDENGILWQSAKAATTPSGYDLVFSRHVGASQQLDGYIMYSILQTDQYDVNQCAGICNDISSCVAFNIYYERDPMFRDGVTRDCVNPPPVTNIKCALYATVLLGNDTTNTDQYDANNHETTFHKVSVGSNGYNKIDPSNSTSDLSSYKLLEDLGEAAIEVPPSDNTYMTFQRYAIGYYSAEKCAEACKIAHQFGKTCTFFNAYLLTLNGQPHSTHCALFDRSYDKSYATNYGFDNDRGEYRIENSQTFELIN